MNYKIKKRGKEIFVDEDKLIFYHFHGLRMLKNDKYEVVKGYEISKNYLNIIYNSYITHLEKIKKDIKKLSPNFNYGYSEKTFPIESFIDRLYVTKLKMQRYLWIKL